MEDVQIVDMFWNRDQEVIAVVQQQYGGLCRQVAYQILNDREESEECENDAYLRAWNAIPPQRPNRFSVWLCRVVRNLALDRYRARQAAKRGGGEFQLVLHELEACLPAPSGTETAYEGRRITQVLEQFVRALPVEQRGVFLRRYWYADPVAKIAAGYGMSESKVKSMLSRIRGRLRIFLQEEGIEI